MKQSRYVLKNSETPKKVIGKIHSIESFGTVDGPGIRFVLFMQGCEFRCLYCHNPDTQNLDGAAYELTPEEAFSRMKKYKNFYKDGGVTVSGGEPLLQPTFLREFLKLCRKAGMHTAIDTAGAYLSEGVKAVLEETDLVLLDIKCIDSDIHQSLTGKPLEPTLVFAEYLAQKGIPVWIRYVLVPGLTDREDLIEKHADFIAGLQNVELVEILPFHKLGTAKYEKLGRKYPLKDTPTPSPEQVQRAKEIYLSRGLKVK